MPIEARLANTEYMNIINWCNRIDLFQNLLGFKSPTYAQVTNYHYNIRSLNSKYQHNVFAPCTSHRGTANTNFSPQQKSAFNLQ